MITISYASGLIAIVAAAAVGATGTGWMLYGAIVENRAMAARITRWERRVHHTALPAAPRPTAVAGIPRSTLLALSPPRRLAIAGASANGRRPADSIVDGELTSFAIPPRHAVPVPGTTPRQHRAEVRRALRETERLLVQARRRHVGRHRWHPVTSPVQRQHVGLPAGWLPQATPEPVAA
jgi:hypothetical protein